MAPTHGGRIDVTTYVTSADGTRIAFDRLGQGSPVVLVSGIFCDRRTTQELADRIAKEFTVINYDRRGRGESGDTAPYAIEREVEDLGALIAEVGGSAAVYGHSSGAGLALNAAASGLPITRLVLHEPPYGPDDEDSKRDARELAESVSLALAEGRHADAIKMFFTASGMPPEMAEGASGDPHMLAVSPTMPYDFGVMGDETGGTIPEEIVRNLSMPTLVISGSASPAFFQVTAARITELLLDGTHTVLDGFDHGAPADAVAPVVTEFLVHSLVGKK
jgi:pimeloyl-ACP methyl ester carboxylesterase